MLSPGSTKPVQAKNEAGEGGRAGGGPRGGGAAPPPRREEREPQALVTSIGMPGPMVVVMVALRM